MPRVVRPIESKPNSASAELVHRLVDELQTDRTSGQPLVDERHSDKWNTRTVNVFWDAWDGISEETRISVIRQAYEESFGSDLAESIVLAAGYTIPEGRDLGLLRYSVISGWRKSDPIAPDKLQQALVDEGASVLESAAHPELRFPTMDDATAAVSRLEQRLPGSRDMWIIAEDVRAAE